MQIDSSDSEFLKAQIEHGEAMLVLGAGASADSKNARGESIKLGGQLARLLASRAGLPYDDEPLRDVLDAVRGEYLSDLQILSIYSEEYSKTVPSEVLINLFKYSWKRVYTFNIDDTIENISGRSAQIRRYYNGMIDAAAEFE